MRALRWLAPSCLICAAAPLVRPAAPGALAPLLERPAEVPAEAAELPLIASEQRLLQAFPGAVARYRAGDTLWLVRQARGATRRLHATAECLRASGWAVSQRPGDEAAGQRAGGWASYRATRGEQSLRFEERVRCEDGRVFADVGAAFWHALFARGDLGCAAVTRVTGLADDP